MSHQIRQLVFHGAHSQTMLVCHLIAIVTAAVLIVLLSHYERKLVSRRLGLTLLLLRLGVLAVILMTLLQPTLTWTMVHKRTGRILVGIDVSESMQTMDRHASKAEKLRVARGLELIGNVNNQGRLDQWQQAFDAGAEPEWVDQADTDDEAKRAAIAASRRESLTAIFIDIEKLTRTEITRRLLAATKEPLVDQLQQICNVELFAFAGKAEPIEKQSLATVFEPSASLLPSTTDLSLGLQPGMPGNGDIIGIILFTDGRDHAHQNLPAIATSFKASNTPVYPVLIGSSYRPKDLSILHLDHPMAVYKGDHPQLKVTLGTAGFDGKTIDVELLAEDEAAANPMKQTIKCTGTSANIEFELDAATTGRKSYTVRIPVLEGETHDHNNSRSFTFNVVDDRAKVLLVDGEARWEFRYLDNAFARDDRIDLKHILFDQPHLGVMPEPFFPRQLSLPDAPTEGAVGLFAEQDLIVIGDVSPEQVTNDTWQQLLRFVSDGGTLVLSAGKRYMPMAHRSAALEQLLPVSHLSPFSPIDAVQEATPRLRGLPLQLNVDGEQQPMLQFAPDLAQNIAAWKGLPGQMWAMLGEAKPASTVWVTTQLPAGQAQGLDSDRKFGVMVHQYVGSGQVVWLGIDSTWRWRYRVGDKYHHRFWAQLARWAATNKMSTGTDFVRFGTEKSNIEVGQPSLVRARWTQAFLSKHPKLKARAEIFRNQDAKDRPFTTVDLTPSKGLPLLHEGRILSLPAGEYQVRLAVSDAELGEKKIESTLLVTEKPSVELTDVSTNRDLLAQIADASGGRLFLPDEVHDLPKMFRKVDETTTQFHEETLWDRWPWLVVLFTLMTTEWITRKLNGLP